VACIGGGAAVAVIADRRAARPVPGVTALLQVTRPASPLGGSPPAGDPGEYDRYRRTHAALLTSEFVANAALHDPKVKGLGVLQGKGDAAAWLAGQIRASAAPDSELIRVELDGEPTDELTALLDAVVRAYLNEAVQYEVQQKQMEIRRLEDVQQTYREAASRARKAAEQTAAGPGVEVLTRDLVACRAELRRARLSRAGADKGAGKDLGAQEELLIADEKRLGEELAAAQRADAAAAPLRREGEQFDALAERVSVRIQELRIELTMPPRVRLLAPAAPRSGRAGTG
jgi:hypothetical protein